MQGKTATLVLATGAVMHQLVMCGQFLSGSGVLGTLLSVSLNQLLMVTPMGDRHLSIWEKLHTALLSAYL